MIRNIRNLTGLFFLQTFLLLQPAYADPLTDLVNALGLGGLLGGDVLGIDAQILSPGSTGGDDTIGVDLLNSENPLALGLFSDVLLGMDDGILPLNLLGLDQLLTSLGLAGNDALAVTLRGLVGPEGAIIVPVVGLVNELTGALTAGGFDLASALALPGLSDQPIAIGLLGQEGGNASQDGLLGVALITNGEAGNGGLIGLAVISGDNSGAGDLIGVSILSGDNSGTGSLGGISLLSGDSSGSGDTLGVGILSGDNSGQGGSIGAGVLGGDTSGTGDFAGVGILSGDNSGTGGTLGAGVLSGEGSGVSDGATVQALNPGSTGGGGLLTVGALNTEGSGNSTQGSSLPCEGIGCDQNAPQGDELFPLTVSVDGTANDYVLCVDGTANDCVLVEGLAYVLRGVNFEFDSAQLTDDSVVILDRAVRVLKAQPDVLVSVDGHTDAIGTEVYNDRLSRDRALAVKQYFLSAGVSEDRLVYRGFGKGQPIASNALDDGSDNPNGRAINRRVELNIVDDTTFAALAEENRRAQQQRAIDQEQRQVEAARAREAEQARARRAREAAAAAEARELAAEPEVEVTAETAEAEVDEPHARDTALAPAFNEEEFLDFLNQ